MPKARFIQLLVKPGFHSRTILLMLELTMTMITDDLEGPTISTIGAEWGGSGEGRKFLKGTF